MRPPWRFRDVCDSSGACVVDQRHTPHREAIKKSHNIAIPTLRQIKSDTKETIRTESDTRRITSLFESLDNLGSQPKLTMTAEIECSGAEGKTLRVMASTGNTQPATFGQRCSTNIHALFFDCARRSTPNPTSRSSTIRYQATQSLPPTNAGKSEQGFHPSLTLNCATSWLRSVPSCARSWLDCAV